MNRGPIPGFYWDEEKRKYFKVQANHLVKQDVKYSKANVNQERRKKQQRENEHKKLRRTRQHGLMKRSLLLANPLLSGTGLLREHGIPSHGSILHDRDQALIRKLQSATITLRSNPTDAKDIRIAAATYVPTMQVMAIARSSPHQVNVLPINKERSGCLDFSVLPAYVSSNSGIHQIKINTRLDGGRMIICSEDNIFTGRIERDGDAPPPGGIIVAMTFPRAASYQHQTATAAVINHEEIVVIESTEPTLWRMGRLKLNSSEPGDEEEEYGPSIDWLDTNTLAYPILSSEDNRVDLWDTRTNETNVRASMATRFRIKDRITGVICSANQSDNQITHEVLISTNHKIMVFDIRMPNSHSKRDASVMSFNHTHEGPALQFAASNHMIAAVDRDNDMHVYSCRTGGKLRTMEIPDRGPAKGVMWYEDDDGLGLQAHRGKCVTRWAW